jgi:ppGpp synthetase/RelA/SpoT-type nucleotidyltranferase
VKEVASYRTKVTTKHYEDPWTDVTDKLGARALVDRASDVDRIHQLLVNDGRLQVTAVTDKRSQIPVDKLAYSGLHLDLLVPVDLGSEELLPCELQIRTFAQDAWSVVSHSLLYKPKMGELAIDDQRAIMRLVALVELFDGEVERVMSNVPAVGTPTEHIEKDLGEVVAAQYSRFAPNIGNAELTQVALGAVGAALSADDVRDYRAVLAAWVTSNEASLVTLYSEYGAHSPMATSSSYLLWSQPESIAILECLDSRPHRLLDAWRSASLPDAWLKSLADATASSLDF